MSMPIVKDFCQVNVFLICDLVIMSSVSYENQLSFSARKYAKYAMHINRETILPLPLINCESNFNEYNYI